MTKQESTLVPRRIVRGAEGVPSGRTYILDDTPEVRSAIEEYRRDASRATRRSRWVGVAFTASFLALTVIGPTVLGLPVEAILVPGTCTIVAAIVTVANPDNAITVRSLRLAAEKFESTPGVAPVPEMFIEMAVPTSLCGADPAQVLHAAVSRGERAVIRAVIWRMKEEHDIEHGLDPRITRVGGADRIVDELVDHVKRANGERESRRPRRFRLWAR